MGGLAAARPAAAAPTAPFTALSVRFPTAGAGGTGALTYDLTDGGAVLVAPTPEGGVTTTGIRIGSVTTLRVTPRLGESLAAGQSIQLAATPTATGSVTHVHILVDVMGWYAKDDSVRTAPIDKGMGSQFLSPGDPERMYDSIQDPLNSNLPFFGRRLDRVRGHLGRRGRRDVRQGLRGDHHRLSRERLGAHDGVGRW